MTTFWQALNEEERAVFSRTGQMWDLRAGQALISRKGTDDARWTAILLSGLARVLAGPADRVIAIRRAGDLVGELSLIDNGPRSATVQAASRVRALALTRDQYRELTKRHPRLTALLLRVVAQRLREADRRRGTDDQRLRTRFADLLVEDMDQFGVPGERGVFVPITSQADVASMIRASRESLAKVLKQLRDQGVLTTIRSAFIVHDIEALRGMTPRGLAPVTTAASSIADDTQAFAPPPIPVLRSAENPSR